MLVFALTTISLSIYRAWVSEGAVRHLRVTALGAAARFGVEGLELSMVLSEVEPIGGFVGAAVAFISGLARLNDPWGDLVNWFRDMTVNRVKYRLVREALEGFALTSVNTSESAAA